MRFTTALPPDECIDLVKGAGQEETSWLDAGQDQTLAWREQGDRLGVRFKRAWVRSSVHNWYHLAFTAGGRETVVDVEERLGLGRGWSRSVLIIGAFTGLGSLTKVWGLTTPVLAMGVFLVLSLTGGAAVSWYMRPGDRKELEKVLRSVLSARPLADLPESRVGG